MLVNPSEMLVNPSPITLTRLMPMVEILRKKLKHHDLDPDNVVMDPPRMPPPSTPNQNFKKFKDPLAVHCLEQAEMACATHHLLSLGGGRNTPSEARGKGHVGGRG